MAPEQTRMILVVNDRNDFITASNVCDSTAFVSAVGELCGRHLGKDINPKLPIEQPKTWPNGKKRKPWELGAK